MQDILSLPRDVHSAIWSKLTVADILRLRQTCSTLSAAISEDKQLWAHIFHRDVEARALSFPSNLLRIEEVDALDIESWVKHAITLDKNYATPHRKLSVRSLVNQHALSVTWLRLILGRWCLVASSDSEQSELAMWQITPKDQVKIVAKIFLEAPVINGQLDDSTGCLQCGLTIGSSVPYILILSISQTRGNVSFCQLAEIPDTSHVRFLRGDIVGFAVRNGDDTYTYLTNWKTGSTHKLCIPSSTPQLLTQFPLEPCIAMTVRNGLVFTLHRTAIHIFVYPDDRSNDNVKHVASLSLIEAICDGQFLDTSVDKSGEHSYVLVRAYIQDFDSKLRQAVVVESGNGKPGSAFALMETTCRNPPGVFLPSTLSQHCFGLSGRRIFCVTSLSHSPWTPPALSTASTRLPTDAEESSIFTVFDEHVSFSEEGLPLPHLITSLSFDDGHGLLLVGTVTGHVRLASFIPDEIISRKSIQVELPEQTGGTPATSMAASRKVSPTPITPDLPIFYTIQKSHQLFSEIALNLRETVVRSWSGLNNGLRPFSNWSNDWSVFECIWDWLTPYARWGSSVEDFREETPSSVARIRLGALGEIIPVMYDVNNHRRVVFRMGERMFYSRMMREGEDDEGWDDFEDVNDIVLGVLPITYVEFLSDPSSILTHLSDRATQRNLTDWTEPESLITQSRAAMNVFMIRRYEKELFNESLDDAIMEGWSKDDWNRYHKAALNLRIDAHGF